MKFNMKFYLITDIVNATPMAYHEYVALKHLPSEDKRDGYLIEYVDAPYDAVLGHKNHITWFPKDMFETRYIRTKAMGFGHAYNAMEKGMIVSNEILVKERKKGLLLNDEGTPITLDMQENKRIWTPDLYSLRCKTWKVVGFTINHAYNAYLFS